MACPEVNDLRRLVAGDVSADHGRALEAHLAGCESCADARTDYEREAALIDFGLAKRTIDDLELSMPLAGGTMVPPFDATLCDSPVGPTGDLLP